MFGRFFVIKVPPDFPDFCHPKSPPCVWKIFCYRGSPWLSRFLSPKIPSLCLEDFRHQGSLLGFRRFFVTKGPPLRLEDILLSRVLPWVFMFSLPRFPLVFGRFFITKVPPLDLEDFLLQRVPPCVWKIFCYQGSSLGFPCFCYQGSSFGFPCFCYQGFLLIFGRFFITKVLSLDLKVSSPRVPPRVWNIFLLSRVPLGFHDFVTLLSPLGFGIFFFLLSSVPPTFQIFCHPRFPPCVWEIPPLGFHVFVTKGSPLFLEDFSSPKFPPWVWNIFCYKGTPLGLEDFLLSRVLPWVWKIFHHQGSPLGFGRFFVTKGPPLGLGDSGRFIVLLPCVWKILLLSRVFLGFPCFCYQGFSLVFGRATPTLLLHVACTYRPGGDHCDCQKGYHGLLMLIFNM